MKLSVSLITVVIVSPLLCFQSTGRALGDEPAGRGQPKIDVGLQLYSVRAQMEKDVPGTLAIVRNMQITDVEVANLYGRSAASFRAALDKLGLKASGVHF